MVPSLKAVLESSSSIFSNSRLYYFVHTSDNPSHTNYLYYSWSYIESSIFEENIYFQSDIFPSGTKIYVIAYAVGQVGGLIWDPISGETEFVCMGKASNIVSMTIP